MMSLTGTALPVVLAVVALGLFAFLAAGIPWVRSRWAAIAARGTGLVVLNLVVVGLVGTLVNDHFGFYVSWSDLAGASSAVTVTHHGASARAAASRGMASPLARTPSILPALRSSGRLQTYVVNGSRSHVRGQVDVLLPRGYDPKRPTRYPVIEALHGFPGSPQSWLTGMNLQQTLDAQVAAHVIAPAVVVLPQGNVPMGVDGECVNGPAGTPQVETWLGVDVPNFVVTHFRVRTERSSWAVAGYSEGGWCAAMTGMLHPSVFGGSLVFSGTFAPEFTDHYRPFGRSIPSRYNLVRLARTHQPALAMWVQSSKRDGYSYPPTAAFLRQVRPPLSVTTLLLKTGGHPEQLWANELPAALRWLGQSVPGFAPR